MNFPHHLPRALGSLAIFNFLALVAGAAVPQFPTREEVAQMAQVVASEPRQALAAPALSVDISSREAVRQFYLAVATIGDDTPIQWTGSFTANGPDTAGTTSADFKAAVLLRINAMRALAGVPAAVTLSDTFSTKAQQAALMMSANAALSHTPPSSWRDYTADGAEAAGKSNLSFGDYGTRAISDGYIGDSGSNNAAVGHRRWILFPQTQTMGTGDIPASGSFFPTNATWILDGHANDARPTTRTTYVAWPAAGFFPAPLIFPRWSFSYPGANFSGASVTMTRDGAPVAVQLEPLTANVGENTLVWVYGGLDSATLTTPTVTTDSVFHVKVSNVVIGGSAQTFEYDVKAFDPARAGSDTVTVALSGTSTPSVGVANTYTVTRPAVADTVQWRTLKLDSSIPTYDAENGLAGLTASTSGTYTPRTTSPVGAGTASYRLATDGFQNQYLTSPETFYAPTTGTPQLTFLSRLGFATTGQVAHVQVSTNDGASWTDLYTQAGSGSGTTPTESTFTARTVSLASVAGLTFQVRFAFTYPASGEIFTPTTATVGWFLDNITLSGGVQRVASASAVTSTTAGSFDFVPGATGAVALQARGALFGAYPMSWGAVLPVNAINVPSGPAATFANIATRAYCTTGNGVTIGGFVISGSANKRVLIRAVGPTLTTQGIAANEVLLDPTIEVHKGVPIIATNDNLADNANAAEIVAVGKSIGASDLAASDTKSAALLVSLAPGVYSFIVNGKGGTSGVVLLEIYDADAAPTGSSFSNIATRAQCTTGNGVAIGGFVVSGNRPKQVLMRAVGPTLTTQGIGQSEVLLNPAIELYDASHGNVKVASNDNWGTNDNAPDIRTTGARIGAAAFDASDTQSAALLLTLQPGVYSFIAKGQGDTSGIVLLEVYDAD